MSDIVEVPLPPHVAEIASKGIVLVWAVATFLDHELHMAIELHPELTPEDKIKVLRALMRGALERARIVAQQHGISPKKLEEAMTVDDSMRVDVVRTGSPTQQGDPRGN